MSQAMDQGKLSDKQLRAMQDRMIHMKEMLEGMQRK